jgi:formamidopyrimidine-DNA glycosylase
MPELPEVETVRRGLAQTITGKRLERLELRREGLRYPFPPGLAQVAPCRIESIERRAKYLLWHLSNNISLILHLGMSGKLVYHPQLSAYREKHDHVVFHLEGGEGVIFNDARRFGVLDSVPSTRLAEHPALVNLGPEPLGNGFSPAILKHAFSRRSAPVKQVIMDQAVVVGVGNIYASEALFLAGIHPLRPANELQDNEIDRLVVAIREVLEAALLSGGSTLRDYVRSSGDAGYFQHHFKVYDRKGQPCSQCNGELQHKTLSGRSTYFCESCQPFNKAG